MIADALKQMRSRSGMTLEEVSKKSGVPMSTISRISSGETKEPSISTVIALVQAMGGSMDELAGHSKTVQNAHISASECKGDNCPQIKLYERQRVADEQWRVSIEQQTKERISSMKESYENRIESIEKKYIAQLDTKDRWIRMLIISTIIALLIIAVIVVADLLLADIGFIRR